MWCETVKLFLRPGPTIDEVDELEEASELCQSIANRLIDSAVTLAVRKTEANAPS